MVSFTHGGVGRAVLAAILDFSAYLDSLMQIYAYPDFQVYLATAGGVGGSVGDAIVLDFITLVPPGDGSDTIDQNGKYVRLIADNGSEIDVGPLTWNAVTENYDTFLLTSFDAALEGVTLTGGATPEIAARYFPDTDMDDAIAEYATYAAKPTKTVRVPLRFVDPHNPTQDYTP